MQCPNIQQGFQKSPWRAHSCKEGWPHLGICLACYTHHHIPKDWEVPYQLRCSLQQWACSFDQIGLAQVPQLHMLQVKGMCVAMGMSCAIDKHRMPCDIISISQGCSMVSFCLSRQLDLWTAAAEHEAATNSSLSAMYAKRGASHSFQGKQKEN